MGKYLNRFLRNKADQCTDSVDTVSTLPEAKTPTLSTLSVHQPASSQKSQQHEHANSQLTILTRDRFAPDDIQQPLATQHPPDPFPTHVSEALENFQKHALASKTIEALSAVLRDFQEQSWTLLERAGMSSCYTPHALKLINNENADKHRVLEDLFAICWERIKPLPHIDPGAEIRTLQNRFSFAQPSLHLPLPWLHTNKNHP